MLTRIFAIVTVLFCTSIFSQDTALKQEAVRFAKEASFLERINKPDDAIEKIEVAVALDPKNLSHRERLYRMLREQTEFRISSSRYGKFKYDNELDVLRIDAETMQQAIRETLRLELLAETFPSDHSIYEYRVINLNRIRYLLTCLADRLHPEFKNEVRAINRRALDLWMNDYRTALNQVVDQESFRRHFREPAGRANMLLGQSVSDLVVPFAEIISNTLRLSQKYQLEEGDPRDLNDTRFLCELYEDFSTFVPKFRFENIAESNPQAATMIEQTIVLLETDPRRMPQIYAWLARNRIKYPYSQWSPEVQLAADAYYVKVKAYLASQPKGIPFAESDILYNELWRLARARTHDPNHNPYGHSALSRFIEIIELADSRDEIARNAVSQYITLAKTIMDQTDIDKTDYRKLKLQADPLILRQFARAERLKISRIDELKKRADEAGIGKTQENAALRPWKTEINIFPREDESKVFFGGKPIIRGGSLYCVVWNEKTKQGELVCVDLETLDKRYVSIGNAKGVLEYIDDANAYFQQVPGGPVTGLYVCPLDGSGPWSSTEQSDLPSDRVSLIGTLNDWGYMVVGDDWIFRVDLKTRKWEQLSSSRAKTGKTPFVNGNRVGLAYYVDDPKRERLLVMGRGSTGWAIEKDGRFTYLHFDPNGRHLTGAYKPNGFFDDGNKLLLQGGGLSVHVLDFETGIISSAELNMYAGCIWNGYFWGGIRSKHSDWKWGRRRIDAETEIEPLAIPEEMTTFSNVEPSCWFPTYCVPTPDGKNLIVGKRNELILLRFE